MSGNLHKVAFKAFSRELGGNERSERERGVESSQRIQNKTIPALCSLRLCFSVLNQSKVGKSDTKKAMRCECECICKRLRRRSLFQINLGSRIRSISQCMCTETLCMYVLRAFLPGNSSQVGYEPAQVFGSYSVMVAPCWKGENGTSASVSATFG